MIAGARRLVGLGSVVVDLVLHVDHLPEPGGDVLATSSTTAPGGGITVLAAATRDGLAVAYAGGHGTGPFGDLVRSALADVGAALLLEPSAGADTGVCVVLVEPSGERTFATTVGAEGQLSPTQLATVAVQPEDVVYVSGYDLGYPHAEAVAAWVDGLPEHTPVVLDPGPLVAELDHFLLDTVLRRTTWLSVNLAEARSMTGHAAPAEAAAGLLHRGPWLAGVVVRAGAEGAVLALPEVEPTVVPAVPVPHPRSTNGAGDVHTGVLVAGLARGLAPLAAVAAANAAAARHVGGAADA